MYFYHVISDIPKHKGEHILLDENHPNGVHQRVYAQMETVKDIYKNPEAYRGKELTHVVDVALRELALEKVRKDSFQITVPVSLSTTFYAWVFQYVGKMSIVAPEHVRESYAAYLEEALDDVLGED